MVPTPAARRPSPLALGAALSVLLAACDGGTGTTNPPPAVPRSTISGTVTLPGAEVAALPTTRALRPGEVLRDAYGQPWRVQSAAHASPQSGAAIPGEYVIVTRPGLSAQVLTTALSALVVPTVGRLDLARVGGAPAVGIWLYRAGRALDAAQSAQVLRTLAAQPGVVSVNPNRRLEPLATPNDTYYPAQWHYPAMNLPEAWNRTTGRAITVAVVDTGIVAHPDLAGQVLPGMDFISDPAQSGDGDGIDPDPTDPGPGEYHGTHVAGTVAARTNNGVGVAGVDWGAKLLPVRALNSAAGSLSDILMGVLWAAGETVDGVPVNPNPARVINLSVGGAGECTAAEQQVFTRLAARGIVTVVAAGNDNVDASTVSPGNCADVITVGAAGPDGRRAPYSNYGARIDVLAPGGNSSLGVTVGADTYPGGVLSTSFDDATRTSRYAFLDGTSMAAPHVSGAVALLLGQEPDLTAAQVRARLKATAAPLGSRCDVADGCGAGLVDARALLVGSPATPAPTPTPTPAAPRVPPIVEALYIRTGTPTLEFDYARSTSVRLPVDTLTPPYTLSGLESGPYVVAAWQDLNGDGLVNEGEPYGAYPDPVTVTGTPRDLTEINLTLGAYSVQVADVKAPGALRDALETLARAGR
ncbi:serine protease [Deinococcus metalli]|uniref:Serine protease n=1 Tax=Deinococcus metalli TaxID=1141878 RepID=A0A7W8KAP5_9DEIO|nr:S8 family serine peptidase [Deinococcus metalli]MBB5374785.1 serine protease [Deinococcus metalli]